MGKNAHGILFAAGEKVLTPGILAKKAGVWRDLSSKGANLWIFGKKGSHVAQPQNLPNILYLFVYQYRLNDP